MLTLQIRRASGADLFDGYRQFYGQSADYPLAEAFLRDRFTNNDSVVFLAIDPQSGKGLGFVQLYPSFSSAAAQRIWILNDLFVAAAARQKGVGRALLDAAQDHGVATGAKRLVLSTAATNREARALYESYGYKQEDVFLVYKLELYRRNRVAGRVAPPSHHTTWQAGPHLAVEHKIQDCAGRRSPKPLNRG